MRVMTFGFQLGTYFHLNGLFRSDGQNSHLDLIDFEHISRSTMFIFVSIIHITRQINFARYYSLVFFYDVF